MSDRTDREPTSSGHLDDAHGDLKPQHRRDSGPTPNEGPVHPRPHIKEHANSQLRKLRTIERARQAARERHANDSGPDRPEDRVPQVDIDIPDYDLIHPIGSGAFGTVWLALNRHDHQFYAIKTIDRDSKVELEGVRTFKSQAADNPHLVPIGHVGLAGDVYYYVMPLADDANGPAALDYRPLTLRSHMTVVVRVPLEEAVRISRGMLQGLELLHGAGGIHRDVKPENILRFDGTWKLGDSGFMRSREEADFSNCGTPGYCPPEGSRDRSADLYAVGKTMFQLLTAARLSEFQRLQENDFLPIDGDSAEWQQMRRAILRACDDDPGNRFASATEMLDALPNVTVQPARTKSTRFVWVAVGLIAAILGVWSISSRPFAPSANRIQPRSTASPSGRSQLPESTDKAAIQRFTIQHYGPQGESALGLITHAANLNDSVSIRIELNQPAFSYLIACDPNGKTHLLSGNANTPPQQAQSLVVPDNRGPHNEHNVYTMNDCPGIQAFVLVVAAEPLPSFREWQSTSGFLDWQYEPLDEDVVWQIRNGQFVRHTARDRGDIKQLRTHPKFLSSLRNFFDSINGIDAYEIWAFRVRATDQ